MNKNFVFIHTAIQQCRRYNRGLKQIKKLDIDMTKRPFTVVLIVPTGIGATIGGYAGDALPVARAIAEVCDCLITHPNVMNGAQLYWNLPNVLYVEGYALDQFAAYRWGLCPVHQNRIGLLLDQAIETDLRWRHLQAADAARATLGLDLTDYVVTDQPLGVALHKAPSGATWGTLQRPDSLLRAAEQLKDKAGATAIAIVARFPDDTGSDLLAQYRQGQGVDPLAGAEAVISHLVVQQLQIPCAHAPALVPLPLDPNLSPRSAAEELGYTFLPCVLAGLSRAPQFETSQPGPRSGLLGRYAPSTVWANQVDAVVIPKSAAGGATVLSLSETAQVIAVTENQTTMQVTPDQLGIKAVYVKSYLEAIGVLVAYRSGVSPNALSAVISTLKPL